MHEHKDENHARHKSLKWSGCRIEIQRILGLFFIWKNHRVAAFGTVIARLGQPIKFYLITR